MAIEKTTNNRQSISGGEDRSNSTFDLKSFVRVDMKTFSQSELYSLSRSSSYNFDLRKPEDDVIPNIDSGHRSTTPITTTTTTRRRIFAFSHRRGPRRRNSDSDGVTCPPRRLNSGSDGDTQVTENRLILNSLDKLVAEADLHDSNPRGDTTVPVVVDNGSKVQKRKRKRKSKNEKGFEDLGEINVNGEVIDLKFLASAADGAFESELNRMTEGMVREDEFLGFLNGLEGRWGSSRKRRKYVDAAVFVKALPVNWKILLSLRPRARRPSLYCRRFVSPLDVHFNSCKDVAFYLKSQFVTNNANPPEEGAMMHTHTDCQMDPESGARISTASHPASEIDFLGNNIRRDSCTPIVGLESQPQKYHGNNIQWLDMDDLTRKRPAPHGLLLIRKPKYRPPNIHNSVKQKTVAANKDTVMRRNELRNAPVNGEGSSNEPKNSSEGHRNFKTRCIWCLVEFFREPVDAETLASSCGFICPKCKDDVSWRFESALSELTQHGDN